MADKKLQCPHCPRRFNMEAHLQRHINAYHPDTPEAKSSPPPVDEPNATVAAAAASDGTGPVEKPKAKPRGRGRGRPTNEELRHRREEQAATLGLRTDGANGVLGRADEMREAVKILLAERDDAIKLAVELNKELSDAKEQLNAIKAAIRG